MKRLFISTLLLAAVALLSAREGSLVIVGGGGRPDYVVREIIQLAGGPGARILIVPAASGDQLDSALYARHQFESCGAAFVRYLILERETIDSPANLAAVRESTAIYFTGGDQNKLVAMLESTRFLEEIRALYYKRSGVIAGTSAGAAVMSSVMITGEELPLAAANDKKEQEPAFDSVRKNRFQTAPGFGFIAGAIVDQHFIKRKRINRLLALVLENPALIGIGIDEQTAGRVSGGKGFSVLGEGLVMILDARQAAGISCDGNGNIAARNVRLHLLKSGDRFDLKSGEPQ